ncbi:MAG TPA: hypothetical protein VJ625_15875 [Propionibacteriaceae bacterium]|nr:hypothetical protein [Propionibacteriaceae bacterium]
MVTASTGGTTAPGDAALSPDERAELERLRAEVADLRSRAAVAPAVSDQAGVPPAPPRVRKQRWRSVVASLLIIIGCILAPLSVVAVWTKNLVTDTDRYVETVAPLARDPAIQSAVADKITAEIFARLDVAGITNQAVDALADRGLPPLVATQLHALSGPLSSGVQSFVRNEVGKVVASDAFADAWMTANRAAHQALVAALTGQTGEGITIANGTVSINLGPFIEVVKQRLVERGFDLANRIPDINPSFTVLQSEAITRAQGAFSLLNAIGNWLPVISAILIALGIYVAKGHRRALVGAGLGIAAGMLVLGLGVILLRSVYLNSLPLGVLTYDAAASFYDTLVRFLRLGLRTVLVFGLIIALAGFFMGRSVTAVRARAGLSKGIGWLRGGAEQAGFRTGPVGAWVYTYKRVLWIAVIAIAALVLVFWNQPTGKVIIGITLCVLVVLVIIEFLGRPPSPVDEQVAESESPEVTSEGTTPDAGEPGTADTAASEVMPAEKAGVTQGT